MPLPSYCMAIKIRNGVDVEKLATCITSAVSPCSSFVELASLR